MSDNSKKNILIVHNYYQISGGEDEVVANEKKMLEEHGHKVILYSRTNSELCQLSVKKLFLPFMTLFNPRTYMDVRKIIRQEKIEVVHVHNTLGLISPSVYYAALSLNIPVVQTIHNFRLLCPGATFYRNGHICEDCMVRGLGNAVKNGCYRESKIQTLACVINIMVQRITGVYRKIFFICLTEFCKEKILECRQISAKKVFVKSNFAEADGNIVPYGRRKNQFVFAGRLDKLKGIDLLLKAWRQLEDKVNCPKLVICGTGVMDAWCKKYIKDNGLKSVEMLGFIPNANVKAILAISKALILPTQWYEGFPVTIVEAYSVGTPVIGSDIGNVGSLIQECVTGYKFRHDSADDLVKIIREREFDLCASTIKVYNAAYTKERNYDCLLKIYNEVTGNWL